MNFLEDQDFALFVRKVKQWLSIDLSLYKEAQMKRRLTTLRLRKGYATFAAFFEAMTQNPELLREFLDRMTINVSEFWRNPNRWELLERKFLPEMLARGRRLKCWSAACSTGEEPYTLAMILAELGALSDAQIIATDIDEGALAKAKEAVYPERLARDVPPRYRDKYLLWSDGQFTVAGALKKAVSFHRHNLLEDRFQENFDLIICRNVMIYFTEEAKQQLYHKFARALKTGGVLFVGSTEQIFSPWQYGLESAETFFYRKTAKEV